MNGKGTMEYLKNLCADLDLRAKLTRGAAIAALPVAAGFTVACYGSPMDDELYEDTAETCTDGIDNDNDGTTDCADSSCLSLGPCGDEICGDAIDNDGDGDVDCDDSDCSSQETCMSYFHDDGHLVGSCSDGADNDQNGTTDCADPSCGDGEICAGDDACSDDQDNDGDGLTDCNDPDCGRQPVCN